jgi:hypothetical protein
MYCIYYTPTGIRKTICFYLLLRPLNKRKSAMETKLLSYPLITCEKDVVLGKKILMI